MKSRILWAALAALTLVSCEITDGQERDPLRVGSMMYRCCRHEMGQMVTIFNNLFAANEYLAAESDEERNAVHEQYFQGANLYYGDNVLTIRNGSYEFKIATGGRLLTDEGAEWKCKGPFTSYYRGYDHVEVLQTITRLEEGLYRFEIPEQMKTLSIHEMTLRWNYRVDEFGDMWMKYTLNGTGQVREPYYDDSTSEMLVIDLETKDLVVLNGQFVSGHQTMCSQSGGFDDRVEAEYYPDDYVELTANGVSKNY